MRRTSTAVIFRFVFLLALLLGGGWLLPNPSRAQTLPTSEGLVADSTELRVLRQLYYATGGDQWYDHANWLQGAVLDSAATWYGVSVEHGDVTSLSLNNNGLQGPLPACVSQLASLQLLLANGNQFQGGLPLSWAQLPHLEILSLSGNQLTGPLPAEWGQFAQLKSLYLSENQFNGPLPAEWGQLHQLQVLSLSNNPLGGELPAEWQQLTNLKYFFLTNNQLKGSLPVEWGQLLRLEGLYLGDNQLSGILPAEWGQLTLLQDLYLDHNQLTGPLPASWGQLAQLDYASLNNNSLNGSLPTTWNQLAQLTYLNLSANKFTGVLPASWGQLPQLASLYLANNGLSGSIPATWSQFAALRLLNLTANQLSGTLSTALVQQPTLSGLYLGGNSLTDVEQLTRTSYLYLNIAGNYLGFGALESLYRAPQRAWLGAVLPREQRPPPQVESIQYVHSGQLILKPVSRPALHAYRYQWQRWVGGQWVDMPGDTLETKTWARASAAEQGTYRRVEHNRWFLKASLAPTELYSARIYADLIPYQPLAQNRPDDASQNLAGTAFPIDSAAWHSATAPPDMNYVRVWTPRVAQTDAMRVTQVPVDSVSLSTQYLDGLGRPVQTVLKQASPGKRDMVQPQAYDALGREPRSYLPYADSVGGRGGYRPQALRQQDAFYRPTTSTGPPAPTDPTLGIARTGAAYARTLFEASSLNRVVAQGAPGEAWAITAGHITERLERPNTTQDSVLRFIPGYAPLSLDPGYRGFYAPGELWGTQVSEPHRATEPDTLGYRTIEWKDKQGQVVLKQVEAARSGTNDSPHSRWLRTAYAYDDFNRLRFVLQPEATKRVLPLGDTIAGLPATALPFLFHYRFDERVRQIAKQVPGQTSETLVVYDQLDRPILSQDPVQRTKQQWSVTKYDALGRVVLTGLLTQADTIGQVRLQARASADTTTSRQHEVRVPTNIPSIGGYSYDHSFPYLGQDGFVTGEALSLTYYDDYDFNNDGQPDAAYDLSTDGQFPSGQAPVADALRTTGMVTQTRTRVLGVAENDPAQAAWLTTTTFYDERARPVQVQTTNARLNPLTQQPYIDLLTTRLDFTGKVVQSVAVHQGPSHTPVQVAEFFTYDHTGRLLATRQQLPGEVRPALLDSVSYNEIGQAVRKTLSTGRLRQDVDYAYNIRGWLTSLNDPYRPNGEDLFNLSLHYERGFTTDYEQYNGNLTGQTWRGRDGVQRAYGYVYDPLNRLLQGDFVARTSTAPATPSVGLWKAEEDNYRLSFVSYDDNGNILTLRRRGLLQNATHARTKQYGAVDNLTYAYQGNRLQAIDDAVSGNQMLQSKSYNGAPTSLAGDFQEQGIKLGEEYLYDANGNLTQDKNKGITGIAYNHLNLPRQIHFGQVGDSIVFRYSAAGQKVAKLVYQTGKPTPLRTDYLGPYQYEQDSLKFFPHAEGRVLRFVSGVSGVVSYQREYTIKDHLGNLRLAYRLGQVRTLSAGLEPGDAKRETQQFDSLSVSAPVAQATGLARSGSYVAKLNAGGSTPQPLGPLTQLGVQKGDIVTIKAFGYYTQPVQHGFFFTLGSFLAGLFQPAQAPAPGFEASKRKSLPMLQVGVAAGLSSLPQLSGGVPKGYLRVLVFDKDSALVAQPVQPLSQLANRGYEPLRLQVLVPQDGYVTAYVGNESDVDVLFDDMSVEHRPGLQVQENSYEPWGLSLSGLDYSSPELLQVNQHQFNGKEQERELGLNWQDFNWRHYDPAMARFFGIDRLADKFVYMTDYQFASNNPASKIELDGLEGIYFNTGYIENLLWSDAGLSYTPNQTESTQMGVDAAKFVGKEVAMQAGMLVTGEVLGFALGEAVVFGRAGVEATELTQSVRAAESLSQGSETLGEGIRSEQYSGALVKVNKADKSADLLAKKLGGESRVRFANDPLEREFDTVSDRYIGQTKSISTLNSKGREQAKATFKAAQENGKEVYYQFEKQPDASAIRQLEKYAKRYNVPLTVEIQ